MRLKRIRLKLLIVLRREFRPNLACLRRSHSSHSPSPCYVELVDIFPLNYHLHSLNTLLLSLLLYLLYLHTQIHFILYHSLYPVVILLWLMSMSFFSTTLTVSCLTLIIGVKNLFLQIKSQVHYLFLL